MSRILILRMRPPKSCALSSPSKSCSIWRAMSKTSIAVFLISSGVKVCGFIMSQPLYSTINGYPSVFRQPFRLVDDGSSITGERVPLHTSRHGQELSPIVTSALASGKHSLAKRWESASNGPDGRAFRTFDLSYGGIAGKAQVLYPSEQ